MTRTMAATELQIDTFLAHSSCWTRDGDALVRSAVALSFPAAIDWVVAVARAAESARHHPDIDIRWRTVTFRLTTSDLGALSPLDIEFAGVIDAIIGSPDLPAPA